MNDKSSVWFRQAEGEYKWAKDAFDAGNWALVCYLSQQASDKAMKALAFSQGVQQVRAELEDA